jgi:predicted PurR-regulated permease PerM
VTDTTGQPKRLVPTWLDNVAALSWRVIAIVAFAFLAWYLASTIWIVVASIGVAIIVAVIMAPFVLKMRDNGRSRGSAALIAWVVVIGAVIGVVALLAVALWPFLAELVERIQAGQDEITGAVADLQLPTWLGTLLQNSIEHAEDIGGGAISDVVGSVAELVGIMVLATFLLFFFLRDGDKAWLWFFQTMPDEKRERITSAGDEALSSVGNYVRGTTVIAAIAATSSFLFMLILGTPLALPLALLTFVTAYIPYFGNAIAGLIVVIITWGAVGAAAALLMIVLLAVRYVVVQRLVRSRVYQHALSLHPVVIFIVLPIGLQLGGMAGLILAVPIAAVGFSVAQAAIDILEPDTPEQLPELVPAWLDRLAQWSWRAILALLFAGLLGYVLVSIPLVLMPVILALLLAATILPIVDALLRRGLSRTMASAVAVGGSSLAIAGVLALAMVSIVAQAGELGDTAISGVSSINDAASGYLGAGTDAIGEGVDSGVQSILELVESLGAVAIVLVLSVLLTFYFLRDGASLWRAVISHLPEDIGPELSAAGSRAFGVLGGYMIGTGAISLVGAASQAAIMWILGLPLVMPVFVLSFFGGFIPYIGSLLTTMLAFFIAVAVGSPLDIVVMAIWTLVFNIVQGNIVAPLVYNRTTSIHPAIVLAAIPAGSAIAGILGMFLVVPVLGVVGTTWRSVLSILGADDDEIPPEPEPEPAVGAGDDGDDRENPLEVGAAEPAT